MTMIDKVRIAFSTWAAILFLSSPNMVRSAQANEANSAKSPSHAIERSASRSISLSPASGVAFSELDVSAFPVRSHPLDLKILSGLSLDNFHTVNDRLLRGSAPSDDDLRVLVRSGVKTILDLRLNGEGTEHEREIVTKLGAEYVQIPLSFNSPRDEDIVKAMVIMSTPEKQPVFVHCRRGADRTGMVVGMYRRLVDFWDYDSTYMEMRRHHFKPFLVSMRKAVEKCPRNESLSKAIRAGRDEQLQAQKNRLPVGKQEG